MKAIIVSSSYTNLERTDLLKEAYEREGYETIVLMTDFVHSSKTYTTHERDGYVFVKTKPYYKNISPQRLYSHFCFANAALEKVEELKPDLLHVLIPANSLARATERYKKRHPEVKVYFDIIDLWPEAMPIRKWKNTFPFVIWKNLRDKHLGQAESVYCECGLFKKVLGKQEDNRFRILYWAKNSEAIESKPNLSENHIDLCYLGSINNIIDMDFIVTLCQRLKNYKGVTLHVIGLGERKEEFISLLKENKVDVCDYGAVYDDVEKQKIFDKCHFGLNVMKNTVCVGLTMKSLDYFKAQLPIINNIQGDTTEFVEQYQIGFNGYEQYLEVVNDMTVDDYLQMRKNVKDLYEEKFTKEAFFRQKSK